MQAFKSPLFTQTFPLLWKYKIAIMNIAFCMKSKALASSGKTQHFFDQVLAQHIFF